MREVDLAYIAGLIDGEGCIGARVKNNIYTPHLSINMTDSEGLELSAKVFGGSISKRDRTRYNPVSRDMYTWEIAGRQLVNVFTYLLPYLRVKKVQALEVLKSDWVQYGREGMPETERTLRKSIYDNLKLIKKYGKH